MDYCELKEKQISYNEGYKDGLRDVFYELKKGINANIKLAKKKNDLQFEVYLKYMHFIVNITEEKFK